MTDETAVDEQEVDGTQTDPATDVTPAGDLTSGAEMSATDGDGEAPEASTPEADGDGEASETQEAPELGDEEKETLKKTFLDVLRGDTDGVITPRDIQTAIGVGVVTQEEVDEAKAVMEEKAKAAGDEDGPPKVKKTRAPSSRQKDVESAVSFLRAAHPEGRSAHQIAIGLGLIPGDSEVGDAEVRAILKKVRSIARDAVAVGGGTRNETDGRNKIYKVPPETPVDGPAVSTQAES